MGEMKKISWIIGVLLVAALLPSCGSMIPILSTETDLMLDRDEKWSMTYVAVLPGEANIVAQQYQAGLDQMVMEVRSKGITATWEILPQESNNTNITYRVNFSGQGYDLLNQDIFGSRSVVLMNPSTKDQVQFAFDPSDSLFTQGTQYNSFTLKSSKILSTNGNLMNNGSVRWVNPTRVMVATVSTAPALTWLWISLLGVGCVGIVVSGVGIWRRSSAQKLVTIASTAMPFQVQVSQGNTKYCPQCGQRNSVEAGFCPHCGSKFP